MGAMRMSKKQAIDFLKTNDSLQYIYTTMIEIKYKGQDKCLGYAMYQQLDRKEYAKTLLNVTTNTEVRWLKTMNRGLVVECILALGHFEQMGKAKELEGIMELVVYLENKILYKDREEIREEEDK
eukprot:16437052-Heterocapsa_arctica.AAC.2